MLRFEGISLRAVLAGVLIELALYIVVFVVTLLYLGCHAKSLSGGGFSNKAVTQLQVARAWGAISSAMVYAVVGYIVGGMSKTSRILNVGTVAAVFTLYALAKLKRDTGMNEIASVIEIPVLHILGGVLCPTSKNVS